MSPRRTDRLAELFARSALELYRRRLWHEVPGDAVFLVRVPTEELPLAANVIGQEGIEYGLALLRGPSAFRRLADPHLGSGLEVFTKAGDLLGVSFEPWRSLPPEFRRILESAGLGLQRDRMAPMALAKPPYEHLRVATRQELRTLVWALRGVLAAHDAGELRPPSIGGPRVLELTVSGELRAPRATTRLVDPPGEAAELDAPPPLLLPSGLRELPRLPQCWLAVSVALAARIRGDERELSAFVVVDSDGPALAHAILQGDDLTPTAGALAAAFRGEVAGAPLAGAGLPREIVFESRRLHAALAPALRALGVEARLEPDHPALAEIVADVAAAFEAGAGRGDADDGSGEASRYDQLKEADRRVVALLGEEAARKNLPSARALRRYFGIEAHADEVSDALEELSPDQSFLEWLAADYRATGRSRTLVERLLEKKGLDPDDRLLLEARRDARLSIFRVDACEPGCAVEVEDVLTGELATIHDRSLSGCALEGTFLPLRLLQAEEWTFPAVAGPPIESFEIDRWLAGLERLGLELTPEGARRDAHLFGRLWSLALDRASSKPVLHNTDGEPLEPHSATFRVADAAALREALKLRGDLEADEGADSWSWLRPAEPSPGSPLAGRTLLGRLQLLGDDLRLEVNSKERLARARAWLESSPGGVRFERATARALDGSDRPSDDRLPSPPPPAPTPEDVDLHRWAAREVCLRWLDQPVPLLGGRTPRQACATAEGRRHVERLVRTMPTIATPAGEVAPPRQELLQALGIE